jgi:hypothetical protein
LAVLGGFPALLALPVVMVSSGMPLILFLQIFPQIPAEYFRRVVDLLVVVGLSPASLPWLALAHRRILQALETFQVQGTQ